MATAAEISVRFRWLLLARGYASLACDPRVPGWAFIHRTRARPLRPLLSGVPPRLSAAASPRPLFSALQSRTVGLYLRFSSSAWPGWDLPSRKSHKKPGKSPRQVPSSRFSAPPRAPSFCFLLLFSVSGRLRLAGACCLGGSRRGGRWSTGRGCDDARRPLAVWKRVHEIGLKPVT